MDGFELLKRLGTNGSMPPAIVLTAFGNIETAIATIHDLGAFWFLEKPIQPAALRILLERASAQSRLAEETERLRGEVGAEAFAKYYLPASRLIGELATGEEFVDFLTQPAYDLVS